MKCDHRLFRADAIAIAVAFTRGIWASPYQHEERSSSPERSLREEKAPTLLTRSEDGTGQSPGGGLTGGHIAGIIAGAVALLLIVITLAYITLRLLNKAIKVSDAKTHARTRTSTSTPGRAERRTPAVGKSVVPLMMAPSELSAPITLPSQASTFPTGFHEAEGSPVFRSPFSPLSPASNISQSGHRGYGPVATSEYPSPSIGGRRTGSVDSTPPMLQTASGYFDTQPQPERFSTNSSQYASSARRPSQHARNWSIASDQSFTSQGSDSVVELEARPDSDRRSSLQRALQGMGLGRMMNKRKSEPNSRRDSYGAPAQTGGPTSPDLPTAQGAGRAMLGHIPEAGESRIGVDNYVPGNGKLGTVQYR